MGVDEAGSGVAAGVGAAVGGEVCRGTSAGGPALARVTVITLCRLGAAGGGLAAACSPTDVAGAAVAGRLGAAAVACLLLSK